jgi:hypothetical protein
LVAGPIASASSWVSRGLGVDVEALGDDVMLDELVGWWLR